MQEIELLKTEYLFLIALAMFIAIFAPIAVKHYKSIFGSSKDGND